MMMVIDWMIGTGTKIEIQVWMLLDGGMVGDSEVFAKVVSFLSLISIDNSYSFCFSQKTLLTINHPWYCIGHICTYHLLNITILFD